MPDGSRARVKNYGKRAVTYERLRAAHVDAVQGEWRVDLEAEATDGLTLSSNQVDTYAENAGRAG